MPSQGWSWSMLDQSRTDPRSRHMRVEQVSFVFVNRCRCEISPAKWGIHVLAGVAPATTQRLCCKACPACLCCCRCATYVAVVPQ